MAIYLHCKPQLEGHRICCDKTARVLRHYSCEKGPFPRISCRGCGDLKRMNHQKELKYIDRFWMGPTLSRRASCKCWNSVVSHTPGVAWRSFPNIRASSGRSLLDCSQSLTQIKIKCEIRTLFSDLDLVWHFILGVFAVFTAARHHHYSDCFGMWRETLLARVGVIAIAALISDLEVELVIVFVICLLLGTATTLIIRFRWLIYVVKG